MKAGGPAGKRGNSWDVSNAAKEKIKFNRRETEETQGSLKKISNSSGRGGSARGSFAYLPFGPQQNPGRSPVRRINPHDRQMWLFCPHCALYDCTGARTQIISQVGWIASLLSKVAMRSTESKGENGERHRFINSILAFNPFRMTLFAPTHAPSPYTLTSRD